MFKRQYHYLAALLLVVLIMAAPLRISAATTPAQQPPPGYPPPPDGLAYLVYQSGLAYHLEMYGPNGSRWNIEIQNEVVDGVEIIQNIGVSFLQVGWPIDIFFDFFPIECEQNAEPTCRGCVFEEVSLCYNAYYAKAAITTTAMVTVIVGCFRIAWYIGGIACFLGAGAIALATICLSVIDYQNCYRAIPAKCNARFPGCINAVTWGIYIQTCLTYSPPPPIR